jgi:hypothetical protein
MAWSENSARKGIRKDPDGPKLFNAVFAPDQGVAATANTARGAQRGDHDHPRDLRHDGLRPRPRKRRRGPRLDRHRGPAFGHFIDGAFTSPGETFATKNPATGEVLAEVTQGTRRTWTPPSPPPRAPSRNGRSFRAMTARNTSTRWPGCCRSIPASSPCWNPSTTASRSARPRHRHPPRAAAFLLPRGPCAASCRRTPRPQTARRLRPDHPVELPAPDAGVEDRAGARGREHGGPETRGIHLAHRASLRRHLPEAGLPKGVVNIVTGDGATGQAIVEHPASPRSPSPAPPPWAAASARRRPARASP